MELKTSRNNDGVYLIELFGAMDLYSSNQLKDSVMNIIRDDAEGFIISLKDVGGINSAGLGSLVAVSSTLKKLNCPLVILVPEGPVTQALEVTRIRGYFTIAASLKEALSLCREKKPCKEVRKAALDLA